LANINYLWKTPDVFKGFATAVSLHGHTLCSKESLHFIPDQAKRIPVLRWALQNQERHCRSIKVDFLRAYWTAPLTPRGAYEIERAQIENKLGLASIVCITDHDTIEGALRLRLLPPTRHIPISLEWTVPYESTRVHLGIYNLPSSSSQLWLSRMQAYTCKYSEDNLGSLLARLNEIEDLLIVLNHPMWDLCSAGPRAHLIALGHFLRQYNQFLHAFELGGLRSWNENQRVVDLANAWNQILISGGDRHACEPSAVLNLTNAGSFAAFAQEIRQSRQSHLLFMPQYQQSLTMRILHTVNDVTRYVAGHPLGPRWDDRTFHPDSSGEMRPLSQIWERAPSFIQAALALFRVLEAEPVKALVQFVRGGSRHAFRLRPLGADGETA